MKKKCKNTWSLQVAPLRHGWFEQLSILISHKWPVQPGSQTHRCWCKVSTHKPFTHGFSAQRLIFSWHLLPPKPGGQSHRKSLTRSEQVAFKAQGLSAQSSKNRTRNMCFVFLIMNPGFCKLSSKKLGYTNVFFNSYQHLFGKLAQSNLASTCI